ncbi:MAG: methyl-accepting chemotaxis protein, partial [Selenomonas sp.]|nr:methyl-accepting chemotaxis protein [Selenomonas sp.]
MGLKQKFLALAGVVGLLMAVMSVVGYYVASTDLQESVETELNATVSKEAANLDGWLREKKAVDVSTANAATEMKGDMSRLKTMAAMGTITSDKEILEMSIGLEDGYFGVFYSPDETGKKDPTQRPWYKEAKAAGETVFTQAYVAASTGKLVVSVATPIKNEGQFIGATCTDIALDVLDKQAGNMKYHGEGKGIIMEKSGNILATTGIGETMKDVKDVKGVGEHFTDMTQKDHGYFELDLDGETQLFSYTTIPTTGWIIGIAVPKSYVFASLNQLKVIYGFLTIFGLLITMTAFWFFSKKITDSIVSLEQHATQLAAGNLKMEQIPVMSNDEIGQLTSAFNTMSTNLRKLITQMATTSEQVAASSEELTANTQQSAEASVHVAETVGDVSHAMEDQLRDINGAKQNVDVVFTDITAMADKARKVSNTSTETANAA